MNHRFYRLKGSFHIRTLIDHKKHQMDEGRLNP